jgi:hypothetical protein
MTVDYVRDMGVFLSDWEMSRGMPRDFEYFTIVFICITLMVWEGMVLHRTMEWCCGCSLHKSSRQSNGWRNYQLSRGSYTGYSGPFHRCIPLRVETDTPNLRASDSRNGKFLNLISQGGYLSLQLCNIIVIGWSYYQQASRIFHHHLNFHVLF